MAYATKLSKVKAAMEAGDWLTAFRLCRTWRNLDHADRAYNAMTRPEFYRAIKRDPDALVELGKTELRDKFG